MYTTPEVNDLYTNKQQKNIEVWRRNAKICVIISFFITFIFFIMIFIETPTEYKTLTNLRSSWSIIEEFRTNDGFSIIFIIALSLFMILQFMLARRKSLENAKKIEDSMRQYDIERYIEEVLTFNAKTGTVIKFAEDNKCLKRDNQNMIISIDFKPLLLIVNHLYFAGLFAATLAVCVEKEEGQRNNNLEKIIKPLELPNPNDRKIFEIGAHKKNESITIVYK